ncbi:hypothetical protein [Cohnella nanjingensis]|uniref:Uncharacterized protein n=1 Tax=Cohnella nanjingensis TaxID=1387779 RepID=A0A7X0RLV7_9BACL|nr:hypothetical protein [Cohnella nanjingensis]MBB6669857.1 hypothetical protein [Cohnella nanjingensis]
MKRSRSEEQEPYALVGFDPARVQTALEAIRSDIEAVERMIAEEEERYLALHLTGTARNGSLQADLRASLAEERMLIEGRGQHDTLALKDSGASSA